MAFTIIVDGHNFLNDLHRHGKDKGYILNKLSFPHLHILIQKRLKFEGLYSHPFNHTEFICSDRGKIAQFEQGERDELITKLKREKGVTVREVPQHTKEAKQKGVDLTVFTRMLAFGKQFPPHEIVLIASDTDYVPALRLMSELGIHVISVGFKSLNEELINESYLFIDLEELLNEMEKESHK